MSSYREIKAECYAANHLLPEYRLIDLTFGNVSIADHARGVFAIKPLSRRRAAKSRAIQQALRDKHFLRKHGVGAYYGQP
jgi:ribulose-5-phosphate 4-epimerase/fuculose-1-phosphate aldolase